MQRISDANYQKGDLEKDVAKLTHLSNAQQGTLLVYLKTCESLFNGELGKWEGPPIDLELKEGAKPYDARAFPIPHIHLDAFKKN